MKALTLVAPRRVELNEMPDPPEPKAGEILVRLRSVGICGSDMHYYSEGGCAGTDARYPSVLGHEPSGEVAAVGPGIEHLKPGARIAIEPAMRCGHCDACLSGHLNLCENCVFLGGVQAPGLMREYAVIPARNAIPIPDGMSFTHAAVVEPLAVLLHTIDLAKLRVGETVAIMGAGPIGCLGAAVSKLAGASRVIVADRIPHRLELARRFGADEVVDITKESMRDAVLDLTHGKGVHVVLDAAGKQESINTALHCLRFAGRLIIIGIPSQQEVGTDWWEAGHKEIVITTQKRSNGQDHDAIDLLQRGLVPADLLVTHRFPMATGGKAFETVAEYADGVLKAVVEM
jgi:L-iditol 2-dehydrogenase